MSRPGQGIPRSIGIPQARIAGDVWLQRLDEYVKNCCGPEGLPRHIDARKIYRELSRSRASVEKAQHQAWGDFRTAQAALVKWMKGKKHWMDNVEREREDKRIPDFGGPEAIITMMILDNKEGQYPKIWEKEWTEMRLGHLIKEIGTVPVDPFWKGAKLEVPQWRNFRFTGGNLLSVTNQTRLPPNFRKHNKKDVLSGLNDWVRASGYTFWENLSEDDPVFNREDYRLPKNDEAGNGGPSTTNPARGRLSRPESLAGRSGTGTSSGNRRDTESSLERRGPATPTRRQPVAGGTTLARTTNAQRQGRVFEQPRGSIVFRREQRLDEADLASRRRQRDESSRRATQPGEPSEVNSSPSGSPPSKVAKKSRNSDHGPRELARQTPTGPPPANRAKSTNRLTENDRPTPARSTNQLARRQPSPGLSFTSPGSRPPRRIQAQKPSQAASVTSSTTPAPKKKTPATQPASPGRDLVAPARRAPSGSRPARRQQQPASEFFPLPAPAPRPALLPLAPAENNSKFFPPPAPIARPPLLPTRPIQSAPAAMTPAASSPAPSIPGQQTQQAAAPPTMAMTIFKTQPAPDPIPIDDDDDEDLILIKVDPQREAENARLKKHYLSHLSKKYGALELIELFDYFNTLPAKFWEGPMDAATCQLCRDAGPKDHNGQPGPYQWAVVLRILQEMFRKMGYLGEDNKLVDEYVGDWPKFEAGDVFEA
ncbi:hypothetical protein V8F33_009342 [Rhypophila sp. PSN 637]